MGGVILLIFSHLYVYHGGIEHYAGSVLVWNLLLTSSDLFVLLLAFQSYPSWSQSRVGCWLQIIGRYTLDVYFIHYFFLPRHLQVVGRWFGDNPAPIVEYALALLIAAMLIVASLLVGRLIRLSPTLAHWLLGAKLSAKQQY